jgi:K+-sensing histidine kinase KdpD
VKLTTALNALIGALLCAWAATLIAILYFGKHSPATLPFLFVGVVLLATRFFGIAAGIVGCSAAALIFATFVYPPIGSPGVADHVAKANLVWMVVVGFCSAPLLVPLRGTKSEPPGTSCGDRDV